MAITRLRDAPWLRFRLTTGEGFRKTSRIIDDGALHTVCVEAACPNRHECWSRGTATFMILGDTCTRRCGFCNVKTGRPAREPDPDEPRRLAAAAQRMRLRYIVVTSVDRDDLPDGGAEHFGRVVDALREAVPGVRIELLTPDFRNSQDAAVRTLAPRAPMIWAHNVETVPRLYRRVRPGSSYPRSLDLLARISRLGPAIQSKSSLMIGLGETREELLAVFRDLLDAGVRRLTLGQYLRPTPAHLPVVEYHPPGVFSELEAQARLLGFRYARCGPLVRSSYLAELDGLQGESDD